MDCDGLWLSLARFEASKFTGLKWWSNAPLISRRVAFCRVLGNTRVEASEKTGFEERAFSSCFWKCLHGHLVRRRTDRGILQFHRHRSSRLAGQLATPKPVFKTSVHITAIPNYPWSKKVRINIHHR